MKKYRVNFKQMTLWAKHPPRASYSPGTRSLISLGTFIKHQLTDTHHEALSRIYSGRERENLAELKTIFRKAQSILESELLYGPEDLQGWPKQGNRWPTVTDKAKRKLMAVKMLAQRAFEEEGDKSLWAIWMAPHSLDLSLPDFFLWGY